MRLRVPDEGATVVRDVIRGESAVRERASMDDLVIARADGTPVYHLAVVVDDLDAGITHVVRGADHYSNTPKQMLILEAMGAEVAALRPRPAAARPRRQEALQAPRRRLRAGAARRRLPAARPSATTSRCSAGATTTTTTFLTTEELQQRFSLERVSKSPAVFDEQKLRWMNGRYMRELRGRGAHRGAWRRFTGRAGLGEAVAISREKIPDAGGLLAAGRVPLRRAGRRPEAAREVARPRRRRGRCWREARAALAAIEGPWTVEDVEAALTGVVERRRRQAGQALPADPRRAGGDDRLARYLRDAWRCSGGTRRSRGSNGATSGLNRPSTAADRG